MYGFPRSSRARMPARLAAVFALLLFGIAPDAGAQAPPTDDATYLYVCVQDDARIAVIDVDRMEVVRQVDLTELGFSPNASPHHVAVEPDGERWYVSLIRENKVAGFDRAGTLQGSFEMSTPGMLRYDAASGVLMASRSMSAVNPPTRVGWVDTRTMDGDEIDVFLPRPHPMALSPDGRWAYTGSLGVNQIAAIELESEDVTLTDLSGPQHALVQFDVSGDGRWLVAGTELSGRLLVFDLADPARPEQVASLELGPMVFDPVFSPDGATVWVPVKGANEVAVVGVGDWTVQRRIRSDSFMQPHQIVFSPDGTRAFVSSNNKADHMSAAMPGHEDHAMHGASDTVNGNVTVVDLRTYEVLKVLELGRNVTGMGIAGR